MSPIDGTGEIPAHRPYWGGCELCGVAGWHWSRDLFGTLCPRCRAEQEERLKRDYPDIDWRSDVRDPVDEFDEVVANAVEIDRLTWLDNAVAEALSPADDEAVW